MSQDSFEQFFKDNRNKVYNYLLRFVEIDDDAQDLLQEVCIAFYDRIGQIRQETALPYMYRMAHNLALNWRKTRKKHLLRPTSDFDRLTSAESKTADYGAINEAIAGLPVKLAMAVHMFYFDKLSYREIGGLMGISTKAVDSLLDRARRKLRRRLRIGGDGNFELIN
jgi:RNA polymerase sigma-70 factor (ECF subfamily)